MNNYYLILKTGESEMRALEHTDDTVMNHIVPIVELTRGRKQPSKEKDPIKRKSEIPRYPYDKRVEKIESIFQGRTVIFDLTSDESLMSVETDVLYDPQNGYENWINFLKERRDSGKFSCVIPSLILSADDDDIDNSIITQTETLTREFDAIAYRNDIYDDNCYEDIRLMSSHLNGKKLYFIIDCSYVVQAQIQNFIERVEARINNIKSIMSKNIEIIVSATSFPRNIAEIGDDREAEFQDSEVMLFEALKKKGILSVYSDYGSINPIRNDTIVMAHGWIPRIDVPKEKSIFYYRERRPKQTKDYSATYTKVANYVLSRPDFPHNLDGNWGIEQIKACASGLKPSSSPSFWISVRMNIHIAQQVKRLSKLYMK